MTDPVPRNAYSSNADLPAHVATPARATPGDADLPAHVATPARSTPSGADLPAHVARPDRPRSRSARSTPLVLVNTGEGKGKSSSAFGVLNRAWAQGWDCGVYQFMKSGKWRIGEKKAALTLSDSGQGGTIRWFEAGDGWSWTSRDLEGSADLAREGWAEVQRRIADETYDFLLLDELTYPMTFGWIDTDEVVRTIRDRPGHQHVFITGRDCPQPVLDLADLVSEVRKVTHPYDVGVRAQPGIEW